MRFSSVLSLLPIYLGAAIHYVSAETVETLAEFKLVTTDSLKTPIVPTGNLALYSTDYNKTGSLHFTQTKSPGVKLTLWGTSLWTYTRPDGFPGGTAPFGVLYPSPDEPLDIRDQLAGFYGYGLVNGTVFALHDVYKGKWWICRDTTDKLPVIVVDAKASRGCQPTYIVKSP